MILGKCLLFFGCTALGMGKAWERKKRTACLCAFRQSVERMTRELTFSLRPLSELMQEEGILAHFFQTVQTRFASIGGESWAESWNFALKTCSLPLKEEDRSFLKEIGTVLGRYDGERQERAMTALGERLTERIRCARREETRLCKVDLVLGITAGLFCVILF